MNMEQAIKALRDNYQRALKNPTIGNPMAWALYKTWRMADRRKPVVNFNKR